MEKKSDSKLITLYQSRSEIAISETKSEYGRLIYSVAYGLLKNNMDAEECENDTYLGLWNKNILCVKFVIVILADLLYGYNGLTRF